MKYRYLSQITPSSNSNSLVLLTGARQTGKTVYVNYTYQNLRRLNFDAPEQREAAHQVHSQNWGRDIGNAIIDEAQKEPVVFDKVKYAFDENLISFSVLTGSSQILLLKKIRESLAGRIQLYELWPLLMSELLLERDSTPPALPPICKILTGESATAVLSEIPGTLLGNDLLEKQEAETFLLAWGGMPALLNLTDSGKKKWLRDYIYTYLERDLADLARLDDLGPFREFQKLTALRAACLLNYSELARDASISVDTAKRYLKYLSLSYQCFLLQPYHKNLTSSVIKTPKVYWVDTGILRQLTGHFGEITGALYETMVISEIFKWNRTLQFDCGMYYYRTRSGMEIDCLIETPGGICAAEIKSRKTVTESDAKNLKKIADSLGEQWMGGMVIYRGPSLYKLCNPDIWAVPSNRLFT